MGSGVHKKRVRRSGEVEIIFNNTDSFDYASSNKKFTGKITNISSEKIKLTDGKSRTDSYKMYKDANGNLVLKGTYSDTRSRSGINKGRNCCEKEALTTHVFRNLKTLPLFGASGACYLFHVRPKGGYLYVKKDGYLHVWIYPAPSNKCRLD